VSSERRRDGASRRIARWTLLAAIGSTGALGLAACLGGVDRYYPPDDGGADTGPATGGDDATLDAPVEGTAEATPGMDGGMAKDGDAMAVVETGPADTSPPPTDAPAEVGPPGQTFDCNGTMVTSCASCTGKPIECVFCGSGGTHPGVCGAAGQYCSNSAPGGATTCTCPGGPGGNVMLCPAPFQVCTFVVGQFYCQSCGEMGSNMGACKGGGHCSDVTNTCQ
jgi:hypothetical protein